MKKMKGSQHFFEVKKMRTETVQPGEKKAYGGTYHCVFIYLVFIYQILENKEDGAILLSVASRGSTGGNKNELNTVNSV